MFSDEMCSVAAARPDVVAITAAMLRPTGLAPMKQQFPSGFSTSGIAEQHAITSAVGMAMGGLPRWSPCARPSSTARSTSSSWMPPAQRGCHGGAGPCRCDR